jgi:hypothetical protein
MPGKIFTILAFLPLDICGISASAFQQQVQSGTAGHVLVRYFPAMFISNILTILSHRYVTKLIHSLRSTAY